MFRKKVLNKGSIQAISHVFTKKYVQRIEDHMIKQLYKEGVLVTLNTDDPAFFNVELLDEYWNLYSKLNFSLDEIKDIILNSIKASFITETKKYIFINKVNTEWEKWKKYL